MKKWRNVLFVLLGLAVVAQFFQTDKTNPPLTPDADFLAIAKPDEATANLIKSACYDCHSHQTKYPWYSYVAPMSWMVKNHIDEGREHLNFSTWGSLAVEESDEMLGESAEEVEEGAMPMASYTWMHPEAKLSAPQRQQLAAWFNTNVKNPETQEGQQQGQQDEKPEKHDDD